MRIKDLKVLHMTNPLGIDENPYFSWKLESEEQNVLQTAYRLTVCNESGAVVWDSGERLSDQTSFVEYEGKPLASATRYEWAVEVKDNKGNCEKAGASFETAFLHQSDWKAQWVEQPFPQEKRKNGFGNQGPATFFCKTFRLENGIKRARLYATAHGVYESYLNGGLVDDRKFAPENTTYGKYLCYQTYDVTGQLCAGNNTLGFYVGDGWYCGVRTKQKFKGYKPVHAVLFQLEVEYNDGRHTTICSDRDTNAGTGPVLCSDLYFGEKYDARLEPDFLMGATAVTPVKVAKYGYANLSAQLGEPVRRVTEVPCQEVLHTKNGETVLDFGQVVSGAVRMTVNAPAGTTVKLEHSEVLDKDGNFTMNIMMGMADQIIEYISNGKEAVFEPHFTFQGFRYVRVSGLSHVSAEDFVAEVYSTEKEDLGTFACSDARINRLYENTRWSQRANMLSIPTDCPQREKAGWTGDIQLYATTSLLNEDTTQLLTRWLKSLACDQETYGTVPMVSPLNGIYIPGFAAIGKVFGNEGKTAASAGWSDAAVLVPWQMYEVTGNTAILKKQYDSMKKWCAYVIRASKNKHKKNTGLSPEKEQYLWNSGYHWGEWLIPSMSKNGYGVETVKSVLQTRKYIAPIFAYYTISKMAVIAGVLGNRQDEAYYKDMAEKIKDAIKSWIAANNGTMPIELQGAYVMPLYFDLVPEQYQKQFEEKLIRLVTDKNYCMDTGFLATPFLFDTLCKIGRRDLAFTVFYGENAPSYFNQLAQGATTIWESWFSYDAEGNPLSVSLNHYAFGCVDDWMFRTFTGLDKTLPGFKHIVIAPKPDESLTWAERSFESEHGTILSKWKKENGEFRLHAEIPCNTTATITLPDGTSVDVGSGTYDYACAC